MDTPDLLVRHAQGWAAQQECRLDGDLLQEAVDLRLRYDALALGTWPPGSAERLLLVTWPTYGSEDPDRDALRETLDVFWSFLRATGRLSGDSASPAELRKEAKQALPKMAAVYDDPGRHSEARALVEYGRCLGIELDESLGEDELRDRLVKFETAPREKTAEDIRDETGVEPGDVRESARLARESAFVRQCLALADWVGADGRPMTARGLLRPAVAREAYQHLDLSSWELGLEQVTGRSAVDAWRSAGDCLPLDRLWRACDAAQLVEIGSTTARRGGAEPEADEEWRDLALALMIGLCRRLGWYAVGPMAGVLAGASVAGDDMADVDAVRAWWDTCRHGPGRDVPGTRWQDHLDQLWYHFADCNLWRLEGDRYRLTDLGRDFAIAFLDAIDDRTLRAF